MPLPHPMIFRDMEQEEYDGLRAGGYIRTADYPKGAAVFRTGDVTAELGVLQSGEIHIETTDLWGNRMILHNITPGQCFGETYAFCGAPMMVDVTAVQDTRVLFLSLGGALDRANRGESWYPKLLHNLLLLSTEKNLAWSNRVLCISAKHIRTRVMRYLSAEAVRRGTTEFTIPFDRQQMADYLNVERSALSKELGRMEREGILTFRKNHFRLHRTEV